MDSKSPSSGNPALPIVQTPFCGELRSKKYYLMDAVLTTEEDYHDGSGHTWCYHTQMPIGPDGSRAAPEYCKPGRSCYRSLLEEPAPYVPPVLIAQAVIQNSENTEI